MSDDRYVVNVEAAIYRVDRWLIARRSEQEAHAGGTLSLIGGKVERAGVADDILEETLRREIREEVGVEVAARMRYVQSKAFVADDGDPVIDIVFVCEYDSGAPRPLDPAEVSDVSWMTLAELLAHPDAPPWTKESLTLAEELRMRLHSQDVQRQS